jgi:hypothetical protein
VASAVIDLLGQEGHLGGANLCGVGLVDEEVVGAGHVGVEGDDLDPGRLGLAQWTAQGGGIVAGDDDGVGVGLDGRLDGRDL